MIETNTEKLRVISKQTSIEEVKFLKLKEIITEELPKAWTEGFGLSAIQVGYPLRYALYKFKNEWHELINPKILWMDYEMIHAKEGCLSIPNKRVNTHRYRKIKYSNYNNCSITHYEKEVEGLEAIIIQHEVDHMDGITIEDRKV